MKHTLIAGLFAVGAGLASSSALAQGYVGLAGGQSKAHYDCPAASTCDTTDTGYKIFGGYMVTPNFGAEVSYADYGKFKSSGEVTGDARADGFGLYGLAVAPFGPFSVFGKLGVAYTHTKVSGGSSDNHTDLAWGLGAGYDFTRNVGVRLEFERVRARAEIDLTKQTKDVDLVSVGVLYRF